LYLLLGILFFVKKIPLGYRVVLCLLFAVWSAVSGYLGVIGAHRLAQEIGFTRTGIKPSSDWLKGALATRDASNIGLLHWAFAVLILLGLVVFLWNKIKK
jgi:hypothetical protein